MDPKTTYEKVSDSEIKKLVTIPEHVEEVVINVEKLLERKADLQGRISAFEQEKLDVVAALEEQQKVEFSERDKKIATLQAIINAIDLDLGEAAKVGVDIAVKIDEKLS